MQEAIRTDANEELVVRDRTVLGHLQMQAQSEWALIHEQEMRIQEESLRLEKQRYEAQRQLEMARLEREKEAEKVMQLKMQEERERFRKEISDQPHERSRPT